MKINPYITLCVCLITISTLNLACAQMKRKTINQIQAIEQEKKSRTAIQQKIESHLLQAVRQSKGEKPVAGIQINAGDLDIDNAGLVNVDIAAEVTDSLLQKIKGLGGEITYPSKEYHTIRAKVPLAKVETIAAYLAVKFIQPAAIAHNNKVTTAPKMNN